MVAVDDILCGHNAKYKLLEKLGEGLTARVYKAEVVEGDYLAGESRVVAIKMLKPGLGQHVVDRFIQEARNLMAVDGALKDVEEIQGEHLPSASPPVYYELVANTGLHNDCEASNVTFMVMELMQARQLEAILHGERGRFTEPEGLRIGIQLFGLFQALHENVMRTYSDFKFENLWMEEDGRVRVTDWNVLSEPGDLTGVPTDLERGTRALIRVITGVPFPTTRRLEQQPHFDKLSIGVQRILRQALHHKRSLRPKSAITIRHELTRLLGYWEKPVSETSLRRLKGVIEGAKAGVEKKNITREDFIATIQREQERLQILLLRYEKEQSQDADKWTKEFLHELESLFQYVSQLLPSPERMVASAIDLLKAGSAPVARDVLKKILDDYPDYLPAQRCLVIVEAIGQGTWQKPRERFAALQQLLRKTPESLSDYQVLAKDRYLKHLPKVVQDDILIHRDVLQAVQFEEDDDIARALSQSQSALDRLREIESKPYLEAVTTDLPVDLESYTKKLQETLVSDRVVRERAEKIRRINAACKDTFVDCKKAIELAQAVIDFEYDPAIVNAVLTLGKRCLSNGQFQCARDIFQISAVAEGGVAVQSRDLWQVAHAAYLLQTMPAASYTQEEVQEALRRLSLDRNQALQRDFARLLGPRSKLSALSQEQVTTVISALWRVNSKGVNAAIREKWRDARSASEIIPTVQELFSVTEIVELLEQKITSTDRLSAREAQKSIPPLSQMLLKLINASAKAPTGIDELYEFSALLFQVKAETIKALKFALAQYLEELQRTQEEQDVLDVLARSAGMPTDIHRLRRLLKSLPLGKQKRLSVEYYRLISDIDPERFPIASLHKKRNGLVMSPLAEPDAATSGKNMQAAAALSIGLEGNSIETNDDIAESDAGPVDGDTTSTATEASGKETTTNIDGMDSDDPGMALNHQISSITSGTALMILASVDATDKKTIEHEENEKNADTDADSKIRQIIEQCADLHELSAELLKLKGDLNLLHESQHIQQINNLIVAIKDFGVNYYQWLEKRETSESINEPERNIAKGRMEELKKILGESLWRAYATLETPAFANTYQRLQAVVEQNSLNSAGEGVSTKGSLLQSSHSQQMRRNEKVDALVNKFLQKEEMDELYILKKELEAVAESLPDDDVKRQLVALSKTLINWNSEFSRERNRLIGQEKISRKDQIWASNRKSELENLVRREPWSLYVTLDSPLFKDVYDELQCILEKPIK